MGRAAPPRLWGPRPPGPRGLGPLAPLAPSGYDDAHPVRRLCGGGHPVTGPVPPRPASGPSHEGPDALPPVLRRLGVSRAGLPLRLGRRAGTPRASPEPPRGACGMCGPRPRRGARQCGRPAGLGSTHAGGMPGAGRRPEHGGAAPVGGTPGGGGVGPPARGVALLARTPRAARSGGAAPLAWALAQLPMQRCYNVRDYEGVSRTRAGHGEDFPPKVFAFIGCSAFKSEVLFWTQIRLWLWRHTTPHHGCMICF